MPGIASPASAEENSGGIVPPGLSMTSSVMPWTMNMDDRVTTIGCRRTKATKKPLKAPTRAPIASATTTIAICAPRPGPIQAPSTTLTSETTAPAERSKPPVRMTKVWPIAASASVAPPADMKLSSK